MSTTSVNLPRASIVTPNYNGEIHINECIKSVVNQKNALLEYIITDGESKDSSLDIIYSHSEEIDAVISEPDTGHANAINKGFAISNGEIMGWINSDDILFDGTIRFIQQVFAAFPEIEWITGRASAMTESGAISSIAPARPWSRLRFLAGDHLWIQQESTFWRRSLWDRAGGQLDESLSVANDFELWARFFRHAELHTVDRQLGCFRVRKGQRSAIFKHQYMKEVEAVLSRELNLLTPDERRTMGELIPEAPISLRTDEIEPIEAELSAFDPPIIRASQLRSALNSNSTKTNTTIRPEFIYASDIKPFHNKHLGERCFILGNGPSINNTNLDLLKDEIVFSCNASFLLFDRISWRPTYYTCVDTRVLPDRAHEIENMLDTNPDMTAFFPTWIETHGTEKSRTAVRTIIKPAENRYYFTERRSHMRSLPSSMFSLDAQNHLVQPHTVAITMMQLAAYMGFSEIYLVGCDTSYSVSNTVQRDSAGDNDVALVSTRDDDANHFDPSYFGTGRKWHVPNVEAMIEHYRHAKAALKAVDVHVFNATVGGALEVFDRISLEDAVSSPRPSKIRRTQKNNRSNNAVTKKIHTSSALVSTVRRNLLPVSLSALGTPALIAALLMAPDMTSRIVVASLAFAMTATFISCLVAIKSRRIVLQIIKDSKLSQENLANLELNRMDIENRLESLEDEIKNV
jgi:hypothetical protein